MTFQGRIIRRIFQNERFENILLLIVTLNSMLMLPFAIYINYAALVTLLFSGRKLRLSANVIPFLVFLAVILFSALREAVSTSGTAESLHYFLSSFFWQIGYVVLILFKRPSTDDVSKMLLWSAFIQALLIIFRFVGFFHFPVYGGLLESNAGLVSIHQREQITAVSVSLSLWIWLLYGRLSFGNSVMCLISLFSLLFTGSTGAFIAVAFMFASRLFFDGNLKSGFAMKSLSVAAALVLFSVIINFISDILSEIDLGEFDVLESTQMISDLSSGGEWLAYKLFEDNSRAQILANYAAFSSEDVLSFLSGFAKNEWMALNGELGSPHSFFLELFVHGGVIAGLYFVAVFVVLFIYGFGAIRGMLYLFSFFTISIINSNNFAMPFLVLILAFLYAPAATGNVRTLGLVSK